MFLIVSALALAQASAASLSPESAAAVFREQSAICEEDAGKLWGRSLCGPILFVDPESRQIVTNHPVKADSLKSSNGIYIGNLPDSVGIANTAMDFEGVRWTMLAWPLPKNPTARARLLMHESWHRIQNELGLPIRSPSEAHLASTEGRILMRMEWRALAAALRAKTEKARKKSIRDALVFRGWRQTRFTGSASLEAQLEMNEGLAEYTGVKLSGMSAEAVAARLAEAESDNSFVRSFAYSSGPAYGLLLDQYSATWRRGVNKEDNLGALLCKAARISLPNDVTAAGEIAGADYGLEMVRTAERAAQAEREKVAAIWKAKLVAGPTLRLPNRQMQIQFDPYGLFPLEGYGTVYSTLHVIDMWGVLDVTSGALIDQNFSSVSVSAPVDGDTLKGDGWTLSLNAGWELKQTPGGWTVEKAG